MTRRAFREIPRRQMLHKALILLHLIGFAGYLGAGFA